MSLTQQDQDKMDRYAKAYGQLRQGQTMENVIDLFGPPDATTPLFSKKQSTQSIGASLKYRIGPVSAMPNVNDILIALYFDEQGKLTGAEPQNVPGLASLRF
jgi:hypothetical protein